MNMSINTYSNTAQQLMQANQAGSVLVQDQEGKMKAETPVNPPGNWTKFKAALSNLPLLGSLGSLRQARAEVESYPIRFAEQQASSRRLLNGFAQDLRAAFGSDIADLALRDIDRTGGTPLTARTVTAVLEQAARSQKNHQAMNNMAVTRFLESPLQGPSKMPGDTDMNGIFLDRNMQLNGTNGWQEALGKPAADFITKYVQKQCSEQPAHSQGHLSNAQIAEAATRAFDLYEEIKAQPGINSEKLATILNLATSKDVATDIRNVARENAIMDKVDLMLNRRNPESMLSRTAVEMARQYNLPAIPDAVLKCISNSMSDMLRVRTSSMPTNFACASDTGSIVSALTPRLEANVRTALEEHCKALKMIDSSTTLNPAQQTKLRELAASRRLDTVQVAQYERVAGLAAQTANDVAHNLGLGNFGAAIESMRGVLHQGFEDGLSAMQNNGAKFWEADSLTGGDMTYTMMQQFMSLAFAGMAPTDAKGLLDQLAGPGGHQLIQGLMESPNIELAAQLPLVFSFMTGAVAEQSGLGAKEARQVVEKLSNEVLAFDTLPEQLKADMKKYE
ncbi:MAG: hypothetical protein H6R18_410 [Proteobacteria bacterium]|nr:hypothetical protein [Pseudomonadota bacterium]